MAVVVIVLVLVGAFLLLLYADMCRCSGITPWWRKWL